MTELNISKQTDTPKIIRGIWQLARGHSPNRDSSPQLAPVLDSIASGFSCFDCADIYTGAEQLLGEIQMLPDITPIRIHTKFVPDLDQLADVSFSYCSGIIERSLKRLQVEQLDLVQFHWWDYRQPFYLNTLRHLFDLKKQGKIKQIGLTNFNTSHLQHILQSGFDIASIQLQASLIDKRSEKQMQALCRLHGIKILAYGSLLGGFISENWICQAEPLPEQLENRSLVKYKLLMDEWGGWVRFQSFLELLSTLAIKYQTSISQIAIHGVLQSKLADSVILGLSPTHYSHQNRELQKSLVLEKSDLESLLAWSSDLSGDVYDLERGPKHASIMKYNLNNNT